MRQVDRSQPAPEVLDRRYTSDNKTETERAIEHVEEQREGKIKFSRYSSADVKDALEAMFHGKCAYCESQYSATQPVDVEHYRPKGKVDISQPDPNGRTHKGYYWLGAAWDNLLPSCIDCNRRRNQKVPEVALGPMTLADIAAHADLDRTTSVSSGKATAFPLADEAGRAFDHNDAVNGEARLLLDPTRDDPRTALTYHVDRAAPIALILPLVDDATPSLVGQMSIQVYGLNRLGLVQARTRLLRDLELLVFMLEGLAEMAAQIDARLTQKHPLAGDPEVDADIDLLNDLADRIEGFESAIRTRLVEIIAPDAPYSEYARAWVRAYVEDAQI